MGSRPQRAWYLARHAAEHVLHEHGFTETTVDDYIGYLAAAICYHHTLTSEQFAGLTESWTKTIGPLPL